MGFAEAVDTILLDFLFNGDNFFYLLTQKFGELKRGNRRFFELLNLTSKKLRIAMEVFVVDYVESLVCIL